MAGWTCAGCTTTYSVGAARCPQCGSTERTDGRGGTVLPSLTVECATEGCLHTGKRRRVHLRTAAPGVLEMPRLVCAGCGFDMPTVAPWPPINDSEDDMPKISRLGGPTNAADIPAEMDQERTPEGSEQPSVGSSSETFSEKPLTKSEPSSKPSPKRARTTASRSSKARTESSSAPSTDGGQETGTSAADNTND